MTCCLGVRVERRHVNAAARPGYIVIVWLAAPVGESEQGAEGREDLILLRDLRTHDPELEAIKFIRRAGEIC